MTFRQSGKSDKGQTMFEYRLFRSTDDGDTWSEVFNGLSYRPTLAFSPTFAAEGLVYLLLDRELLRSTDAGITWTRVALAGEEEHAIAPRPLPPTK